MTIHYMAGLPRSGSTLLGNILAQHPDIHMTGTSPLYACVEALSNAMSNSPDIVSELTNVPDSYDRYMDSVRSFINRWHGDHPEKVVVDKHRAWPHHQGIISDLDPESRIIACVRDPRDIVASFEKQERRTALFNSPIHQQIFEYASKVMAPDGMVGAPIKLCEDLVTRKAPVLWVRYESFVLKPEPVLAELVKSLDLEEFEFDLENIENVATDLDPIYRNKFPHVGSGSLQPPSGTWRDVFTDDLGKLIAQVHPKFMSTFQYPIDG